VAHPIRGAPPFGGPQILCVAHVIGCATDIMCGARNRVRHAYQATGNLYLWRIWIGALRVVELPAAHVYHMRYG
jgi:hypothetical protein